MRKVKQSKFYQNKIKEAFRNKEEYRLCLFGFSYDKVFTSYPYMRSNCHKHFSNKQERSKTKMHLKEYKEYETFGFRIRGKRNGSLPDPWDDYPSFVWNTHKSWKHNSKRKKQWNID